MKTLVALMAAGVTLPVYGADVLETLKSLPQYTSFAALVEKADMGEYLQTTPGLTLLAPTNSAMNAVPSETMVELEKEENRLSLADLIRGHIIPDTISASVLVSATEVPTANDAFVSIGVDEAGAPLIDIAHLVETDIVADNGLIQGIDAFLIPLNQ